MYSPPHTLPRNAVFCSADILSVRGRSQSSNSLLRFCLSINYTQPPRVGFFVIAFSSRPRRRSGVSGGSCQFYATLSQLPSSNCSPKSITTFQICTTSPKNKICPYSRYVQTPDTLSGNLPLCTLRRYLWSIKYVVTPLREGGGGKHGKATAPTLAALQQVGAYYQLATTDSLCDR